MITFEKFLILKSVQMFKHTPDDVLMQVAIAIKEKRVAAGEEIIQKDELGTTMYVIVEGKVKVFDENKTLAELGAREVFGELSALTPEKRIASVVAIEDTLLIKIEGEVLYDLMNLHVGLAKGIIEFLCYRVRQIASQKTF